MYNDHPYLDPYSNFPGAADQAASLAAREASWTLGNDYVNGQLFDAQRINSQFAQQEAAQRLQAEAAYMRDQQMRQYAYSQPVTAYVPTQTPASKDSPSRPKSIQPAPKPASASKVQTDREKVAAFLAANYTSKSSKPAKIVSWKSYFEDGGFDLTLYALSFVMVCSIIATAVYFFANN